MKEILVLKENIGAIKGVGDLFQKIKRFKIDYNQENCIVFYLNLCNKIVNQEILFKGGLNSCNVDMKILFKNALLNNAYGIILAHNHPSKDLTPSTEDMLIFEKLKDAGDLLDIKILYYVVFNDKEFYSVR